MSDDRTTCDKCGEGLSFALGGAIYCPACARGEARDLKPRTSPNELTVVVNIDASAAIAEVDKFVDMMRERMATVVNIACKGDVRAAADLVRERDALREELAACKRERDEAREALAAATTTVDTFVTGLENLAAEIRKARGEEL